MLIQSIQSKYLFVRAFKGTGVKIPSDKKLSVGIIGSGLAGMITAMELSEAGHDVEIFDSRRFVGGKVGSWVDKDGNHIEMGLHVFFGCYYNLFGIMKRIGALQVDSNLSHFNILEFKSAWLTTRFM